MSDYRTAEPIPVETIALKKVESGELLLAFAKLIGLWLVGSLVTGYLSYAVAPHGYGPPAQTVTMLLVLVAVVLRGRVVLRRLNHHHFDLEVGATFLRLRAPNGDTVADTRNRDLTFERCTYIRRARNGEWVRPGWRMRHPRGEHLVGTLGPQDVFPGVPKDDRTPDFELNRTEFPLLKARLDSLSTNR